MLTYAEAAWSGDNCALFRGGAGGGEGGGERERVINVEKMQKPLGWGRTMLCLNKDLREREFQHF